MSNFLRDAYWNVEGGMNLILTPYEEKERNTERRCGKILMIVESESEVGKSQPTACFYMA